MELQEGRPLGLNSTPPAIIRAPPPQRLRPKSASLAGAVIVPACTDQQPKHEVKEDPSLSTLAPQSISIPTIIHSPSPLERPKSTKVKESGQHSTAGGTVTRGITSTFASSNPAARLGTSESPTRPVRKITLSNRSRNHPPQGIPQSDSALAGSVSGLRYDQGNRLSVDINGSVGLEDESMSSDLHSDSSIDLWMGSRMHAVSPATRSIFLLPVCAALLALVLTQKLLFSVPEQLLELRDVLGDGNLKGCDEADWQVLFQGAHALSHFSFISPTTRRLIYLHARMEDEGTQGTARGKGAAGETLSPCAGGHFHTGFQTQV